MVWEKISRHGITTQSLTYHVSGTIISIIQAIKLFIYIHGVRDDDHYQII